MIFFVLTLFFVFCMLNYLLWFDLNFFEIERSELVLNSKINTICDMVIMDIGQEHKYMYYRELLADS